MIRKAAREDLTAVEQLFEEVHTMEEQGGQTIGWIRGVYPTRKTAEDALKRADLFVLEEDGQICGAGIINQIQVDVYEGAPWLRQVEKDQVCVLHTLVISPQSSGKGYGRAFVQFYEEYAKKRGWPELRIDTNARNSVARALYKKLGYREIGIVPTVFNRIPGVDLVLLEKYLG